MKVALGADHAGFALKDALKSHLDALGIEHHDFGTSSADSVDYPDFARAVAEGVASGRFDRGILVCGSGIGMSIAANKIAGIRAAVVGDEEVARLCREHNDANVLALGARMTAPDRAQAIVGTFLLTPFEGGRHTRRVEKIHQLESPTT
jgi:ribose 5-phosphate isomerase B